MTLPGRDVRQTCRRRRRAYADIQLTATGHPAAVGRLSIVDPLEARPVAVVDQ